MVKTKRIIILIFLFLLFLNKSQCAIYLPFKILENGELNNNNPLDIVKNWKQLKLYTGLMIGEPPNKIGVFFVSNIFELSLFQNMCDINNSSYNQNKSSSYNFIKSIHYYFNKVMLCYVITEKLYLFTDIKQKNKVSIGDMVIVYSENKEEDFNQDEYYKEDYKDRKYEYHPNTCLNIGFQARQNFNFGGNANFVKQISAYRMTNGLPLVNTYDYFFDYTSENEGHLIIGEKPHDIGYTKFKENQYILTAAQDKDYSFEWVIEFDSIYYEGKFKNNKTEYNRTFNGNLSVKIDLTYGLVEGSNNYEKSIKEDFFDKLINDKNCFIGENNNAGYRFYYCDKKSLNYIQKNFPTLKFCLNNGKDICFDFGYKELFKEKNDKLYFLIYFNTTKDFERFSFGKIFMKKYILTFNYDNKTIGFYNENIENKSKSHNIGLIISIIIGFILFFIAGYYVGKKRYEQRRKKSANELDDDYEYKPQEEKMQTPENGINN